MYIRPSDIIILFSHIEEGITTSPCSITRQMGSTAIISLHKTITLPVRIGHPSGKTPPE